MVIKKAESGIESYMTVLRGVCKFMTTLGCTDESIQLWNDAVDTTVLDPSEILHCTKAMYRQRKIFQTLRSSLESEKVFE